MAVVDTSVTILSPDEHRRAPLRAIGTAVEWYDLFLCSLVAGLVFAKLGFPHSDPLIGVIAAFSIYVAVCVAGPVGAAFEAREIDVASALTSERLDRSAVPARAPGA